MAMKSLIMAMDFKARKGAKYERFSYRRNGEWFLVESGPKHSNTYRLSALSDKEIAYLETIEDKGESR